MFYNVSIVKNSCLINVKQFLYTALPPKKSACAVFNTLVSNNSLPTPYMTEMLIHKNTDIIYNIN